MVAQMVNQGMNDHLRDYVRVVGAVVEELVLLEP